MILEIAITPLGHLLLRESAADDHAPLPPPAVAKRLEAAFSTGGATGLLHLATVELQSHLPPEFEFLREFARQYLTRLCRHTSAEAQVDIPAEPPPTEAELATLVLQAPPMPGLEYLRPEVLQNWWIELDDLVRREIRQHPNGAQAYLAERNPVWRLIGKVTFHLAENKRDPEHPFAFLATFASKLSPQGRVQHEPLAKALQQYAGAKNKPALLSLLMPIQRAAERSELVKELIDSGAIYQPRAWTPREAYRFLQDIPVFEESGLVVRVPDWWQAKRPPRPIVGVTVNSRRHTGLGADALLDFSVNVSLGGESLTEAELQQLMSATGGLVQLKGQWVEVNREKLSEALDHWKKIESHDQAGGVTFFEGMRLLSGAPLERDTAATESAAMREWVGLTASDELAITLARLRSPAGSASDAPAGLRTELRPYQRTGVSWLRFATSLGLGTCLADDMGLGKTVQVIALLLHVKGQPSTSSSLLIAPASLIANWKAELKRFAPGLSFLIVHPSEVPNGLESVDERGYDLIITTYGMVARLEWLRKRNWRFVILDEAQAIKNPSTRQAKSVKELQAAARIALTGTPVENRLGDLWSLFDFLNPGLLGGPKAFKSLVKRMEETDPPNYGPLRSLVQPYILRRLKTDKRVIADLPEKTEMRAFCNLSKPQAALYQQAVDDLAEQLRLVEQGIKRRVLILTQLMRLKQICNHPSQLLGVGEYDPSRSGKFQRLAELSEELAGRQEKALVFTQFREIAEPLVRFLESVFGRPGLVLHGGTAVAKRQGLVEQFQREDGPPFFVLSVKAGGTGLNLTAASHVIHFDRWWNPAVENQATDRAFRIGQTRNVFVHKFVCQGTIEERIDALIEEKKGLAHSLLEGGETLLTEMDDKKLLEFVALDINKALE